MNRGEMWNELNSLPPEARRQVFDFIAFLRARYDSSSAREIANQVELGDEVFVGLWRDRRDLGDSTAWVRDARMREW